MRHLDIITNTNETTFNSLNVGCDGAITHTPNNTRLHYDNECGFGEIVSFSFNPAITYFTYDIVFTEDTALSFNSTENQQTLSFCYCDENSITQRFHSVDAPQKIYALQVGVFSNSDGGSNIFTIQKGLRYKFTIVHFMAPEPVLENTDPFTGKIMQLFKAKEKNHQFTYISPYNVKIRDKFNEIDGIVGDDLASMLVKKGLLQVCLGMIVRQHTQDSVLQVNQVHGLNQLEFERIKEISDFIKRHPDQPFDVTFLSQKTGLTPAKLQQGFKKLHGRTVSNFVKNVRVEYAERLITTTDLNISEIVYTIGLSSRSYFSKIFKEKYNCSPKEYQDSVSFKSLKVS